jgi:RNA polymerase sigma factor (sigma-70 family)
MRSAPRHAQRPGAELVRAAQHGDQRAIEALVAGEMPHVYNVIGRALNGHADVDDVVQETLLLVIRDLPALRDPQRLRSWVLAIANRQVLVYLRARHKRSRRQQELLHDAPDPGSDFAAQTITELLLEGQRRELAEAARWLGDDDRLLLSLWWQEATAEITRAELAEALEITPGHAAVRVKRMKEQLQAARTVIRALAATRCPDLAQLTHGWNGTPNGLWRKRLARHIRDCKRCSTHRRGLVAPEKLLLGLLPVALPVTLTAACYKIIETPLAAPAVPTAMTSGWQLLTNKTVAVVASVAALAGGGLIYAVYTEPTTPEQLPSAAAPPAVVVPPAPIPSASLPTAASSPNPARGPNASVTGVTTADYFVAPDGSDANDGTRAHPFATIGKAVAKVRPGQTIALRGGIYEPTTDVRIETSGTATKRITLSNYRDEQPVIDAAGVPDGRWAVTHLGDYWTVQGLEIKNSHTQAYVCVSCRGMVFQRLSLHDNVQGGLLLRGNDTVDNQVLDSDFYGNHDPASARQAGVGVGVRFGLGRGNVLRGNRAYDNGDNGFDQGGFGSPVTVEFNWAWGNGRDHWNMPGWTSAASGFALGGGSPAPAAAHVVRQNASWDNAAHGFSDDENPAAIRLNRNTAWRNADAGFSMRVAAAQLTANVAVGNGTPAFLTAAARATGNTWNQASPPTAAIFRSTDPAKATGPRNPDGSLPSTTFLTGSFLTSADGIGATMRAP